MPVNTRVGTSERTQNVKIECEIVRIDELYICKTHAEQLITLNNFVDKMMESDFSGKQYLQSLCCEKRMQESGKMHENTINMFSNCTNKGKKDE